jgi:phenylalanyl-tRNA synthetase beta chain
MKISLKWLKDYVDINVPISEVADRLTLAGNEVGRKQEIGGGWDNVLVGLVMDIKPHPNADRLNLATVDLGGEQQTVVCGAHNFKVGDKVAFARVGAHLIDGHTGEAVTLKPAKIRGVVSSGMICSEKELGISENHTGILVLPGDAPIGTPLKDYIGDTILDIEVTPNRPDCLSVTGIAREVAALTGEKVHLPELAYREEHEPITDLISVKIADPDLCPRYTASLINGVRIGESPEWLKQRLQSCGVRPINNVVDITNYVMLEYGQPLHSFDHDKIRGRQIIVRRARDGETIVTLDGIERKPSRETLVIADKEGAVAIAGVMGGVSSEVTPETTCILLESANFNPASIHRTAGNLKLASEASMRFERGIRAKLTVPALRRATQLMLELTSGKAAQGIIDVYPGKKDIETIPLTAEKVNHLLGTQFSLEQIITTLNSLGCECNKKSDSELRVTPPYWRSDIRIPVDLVEEVARITGYDKIPTTLLGTPLPHQSPEPVLELKKQVRSNLVGSGFQEIISYSLTGLDSLQKLSPQKNPLDPMPLRVMNPMTAEQEYLRPTLRAHLLAALAANRRFDEGSIRLFELGKVYLPRPKDLPREPEILCGIIAGAKVKETWTASNPQSDFYDAKGIVEKLLNQLGISAEFSGGRDATLLSGRQTSINVDGRKLGVAGEVHPRVLAAFDIVEPVYLYEIDVTALLPHTLQHKHYQPIPRFPTVVRDIALVLDDAITHQQVMDILQGFALVTQVALFDVYMGDQLPAGKKSLAYRIIFQSPAHTLTDEEVNRVLEQIVAKLSSQLGSTLRA